MRGIPLIILSIGGLADQHLKHEGADLAIIDINLPTLDGVTITKNIRTRKQLFPIIILTARGATKDRVIGLDAGADDYLVKPFKMDELERTHKGFISKKYFVTTK